MTSIWPTPVVAVVVLFGAVVMGYGARMAGGCTSGHGICGTAQRSAASWATTATFMHLARGSHSLPSSDCSLGYSFEIATPATQRSVTANIETFGRPPLLSEVGRRHLPCRTCRA